MTEDLLWPDYATPGDPGHDRGRTAGEARAARIDLHPARPGGHPLARTAPRSPPCRTPPAGGNRSGAPSRTPGRGPPVREPLPRPRHPAG
jgi:hypothetical protein